MWFWLLCGCGYNGDDDGIEKVGRDEDKTVSENHFFFTLKNIGFLLPRASHFPQASQKRVSPDFVVALCGSFFHALTIGDPEVSLKLRLV